MKADHSRNGLGPKIGVGPARSLNPASAALSAGAGPSSPGAAYCRHAASEAGAMPDKLDYARRIDALHARGLEQMVRDDAGPDPTDR